MLANLQQGSTFDCRAIANAAVLKASASQQVSTPTVDDFQSVTADEMWQPQTLLVPANRQAAGLDALVSEFHGYYNTPPWRLVIHGIHHPLRVGGFVVFQTL